MKCDQKVSPILGTEPATEEATASEPIVLDSEPESNLDGSSARFTSIAQNTVKQDRKVLDNIAA